MRSALPTTGRWRAFGEDLRKVPAFLRRDLLSLFSYKIAYVTDWISLIVQVALFYFLSQLIPADRLPRYGGRAVSYMEYVTVAITLTAFIQASLGRLIAAIRNEQMMGTIESLMVMPLSPEMLQLGSVFYDLIYVPMRSLVFLILVTVLFDVHFNAAGLVPMAAVFLVLIPFMWGLGVMSAAAVLTFKRGSGLVGIAGTILTLTSGAYFPVGYLPGWLQSAAEYNPIALAIEQSRQALLASVDWSDVTSTIIRLIPMAVVSLGLGLFTFRRAMERERWRGTMGLY